MWNLLSKGHIFELTLSLLCCNPHEKLCGHWLLFSLCGSSLGASMKKVLKSHYWLNKRSRKKQHSNILQINQASIARYQQPNPHNASEDTTHSTTMISNTFCYIIEPLGFYDDTDPTPPFCPEERTAPVTIDLWFCQKKLVSLWQIKLLGITYIHTFYTK